MKQLEQQQQYEMEAGYCSSDGEGEGESEDPGTLDEKYLTMSESQMNGDYFNPTLSDIYTSQASFHPHYS